MNDDKVITGLQAAQHFKYYMQFKQSYIVDKVELRRIAAKSLYCKYKKHFDKLVEIFSKHELDVAAYIKFYVLSYQKSERDIRDSLLSMKTVDAFIDYLKTIEKKQQIYKWFEKSVENISSDCISMEFFSTKDYIRELVASKKLAQYYLTGKISKYWLAAIPTFKKVIDHLDDMSKAEFKEVYDRFDIYNTEINEAFLMLKQCKANPLKITDDAIFQKRQLLNRFEKSLKK